MIRFPRKIVATGHRPHKLYPNTNVRPPFKHWLGDLTNFAFGQLRDRRRGTTEVISGMALGWDMAIATAALQLGLPLIAAVPFEGQERLWSGVEQQHYRWLLERATEKHVICNYQLNIAYQKRDEWMVDRGTELLSLWDGSSSGTGNTIQYAEEQWGLPPYNVWDQWCAVADDNFNA